MQDNLYTEPFGFADALRAHDAPGSAQASRWPLRAAAIAVVVTLEVAQWLP